MSALTTATEIDLQGINGNLDSASQGIKFGVELLQFAESLARRDDNLAQVRTSLLNAAGPTVLVDAAGVAANFQRMVRIADSIGIPLDNMDAELGQQVRHDLNLTRFASAKNTLEASN